MRRILAFGVFDGLHPGHLTFLAQARRLGDALTVVLTRDAVAARAKGRKPRIPFRERMRLVAALRVVDAVVAGDPPRRYGACLKRLKPDVVAVGYDQMHDLRKFRTRLRALGLPKTRVVRLKEHHGHRYHSSKLGKLDMTNGAPDS
ncbi:adenylyltransferase/cytidyltransferase family protein [Candidatus Uhrbacteria bacterium]|nr:adenylyltransferase/cytidyltransferase family protein [Candidatus Uhrbacteria bacterium]